MEDLVSDIENKQSANWSTIVLYYPPKLLGGAELLFLRIAYALASSKQNVVLIDSFSGWYKSRVERHPGIAFRTEEYLREMGENDVLVTTTLSFETLLDCSVNCRVLFWSIHPYHFLLNIPFVQNRLFRHFRIWRAVARALAYPTYCSRRRFLEIASDRKAIVFMDLPNLQATETFYNVTITNPDLLPIPVSISEISANKQIEVNGALKILWVGRLCDFKVPSLLKVWDDLRDALQVLNLSVEFTVVGSGPLSSKVASFAKDQPYKICLVGEIPASDISAVMVRHDLVFAMGTSALEAAASGVPCCCLDASYSQLPKNYRYRWVHECRGFGLGWIMDKNSVVPSENQWAMIDLLREVVTNWAGQQRLCYDYAESNHNVASLSENLISRIGKTSLLLGDLEGLKRRDPIRLFWRWLKNVPFAIRKILSTGSRMIE